MRRLKDFTFPGSRPPEVWLRLDAKSPPLSEDTLLLGKALTGHDITGVLILGDRSPRLYYEHDGKTFEAVLMVMTTKEVPST